MNQNHHEFDGQMLVSKQVPIGYKYVIPKGTRVWNGGTSYFSQQIRLEASGSRWFGDRDTARRYCKRALIARYIENNNRHIRFKSQGLNDPNPKHPPNNDPMLYEFKFTEDCHLWALDHCDTIEHLLYLSSIVLQEPLRGKFQTAVLKAFECADVGTGELLRNSVTVTDRIMTSGLCALDNTGTMAGYANRPMRVQDGGLFHAELFLCNPPVVLKSTGNFEVTNGIRKQARREWRKMKHTRREIKNQKRARDAVDNMRDKRRRVFVQEEEEEEGVMGGFPVDLLR